MNQDFEYSRSDDPYYAQNPAQQSKKDDELFRKPAPSTRRHDRSTLEDTLHSRQFAQEFAPKRPNGFFSGARKAQQNAAPRRQQDTRGNKPPAQQNGTSGRQDERYATVQKDPAYTQGQTPPPSRQTQERTYSRSMLNDLIRTSQQQEEYITGRLPRLDAADMPPYAQEDDYAAPPPRGQGDAYPPRRTQQAQRDYDYPPRAPQQRSGGYDRSSLDDLIRTSQLQEDYITGRLPKIDPALIDQYPREQTPPARPPAGQAYPSRQVDEDTSYRRPAPQRQEQAATGSGYSRSSLDDLIRASQMQEQTISKRITQKNTPRTQTPDGFASTREEPVPKPRQNPPLREEYSRTAPERAPLPGAEAKRDDRFAQIPPSRQGQEYASAYTRPRQDAYSPAERDMPFSQDSWDDDYEQLPIDTDEFPRGQAEFQFDPSLLDGLTPPRKGSSTRSGGYPNSAHAFRQQTKNESAGYRDNADYRDASDYRDSADYPRDASAQRDGFAPYDTEEDEFGYPSDDAASSAQEYDKRRTPAGAGKPSRLEPPPPQDGFFTGRLPKLGGARPRRLNDHPEAKQPPQSRPRQMQPVAPADDFAQEDNFNDSFLRTRQGEVMEQRPYGSELFFWLQTLVITLVSIVVLFTFCGRVTRVVGSSMNPTLTNGQLLFIWSAGYVPKQGDIVVFNKVTTDYFHNDALVKRVIATGGQTVDIDYDSNTVYVDGVPLEEDYINGVMYLPPDPSMQETHFTVPIRSIFVMGDNRNASTDGRHVELGCIDVGYLLGKAVFSILPPRILSE